MTEYEYVLKRTHARYRLEKQYDPTGGNQGSYNLKTDLEAALIKAGAIAKVAQSMHGSCCHVDYESTEDFRVELGENVLAIIGHSYKYKTCKAVFTHTEMTDGSSAKFQVIKTKFNSRGDKFSWFVALYEKNFQGCRFVVKIDEVGKKLLIDIFLPDMSTIQDDLLADGKDQKDDNPPTSDSESAPNNIVPQSILIIALESFRALRASRKAPGGWDSFDAWAKSARKAFDDVSPSKASDPTFDYAKFMREFAISIQVANTQFANHSTAEKSAVLSFLRDQKSNPNIVSWYIDNSHRPKVDDVEVKGMGAASMLFFMMELHPELYASWSEMAYDSLSKVGLHIGPPPAKLTLQSYDDCKAKQYQVLAKMNEMGIGRASDDPTGADYITVNEFLWFVSEQYDLIMKEWSKHMKKEIKLENQGTIDLDKFEDFIKEFHTAAKNAGLTYNLDLVKRFICALLSKPFVVLTGLSGSGKTKLAQAFTQWIAIKDTYQIVPVGADWVNNEKLLGYPNALDPNNYILPDTGVLKLMIDANDNPNVPFFLILDEMNLSHVERYFADFLSAMESKGSIKLYDGKNRTADDGTPVPPTIQFPQNLFVIGTMNVDETTHMFSPKVLDRAQVIEFRVSKEQMEAYLDEPKPLEMNEVVGKGLKYADPFLKLHHSPCVLEGADKTTVNAALKTFFPALAELGSEFAFRTANEALLFCAFARKAKMTVDEAVDAAIMQKLLPKLHGSRRRLAQPLEAFWEFCRKAEKTETLADVCKKDATVKVSDVAKFGVSAEKIKRLYKAAETNGFASYAEA